MQDHDQRIKPPSPDSRGSPDGHRHSFRQRRTTEHEDRFSSPGKTKTSGGLTHYFNFPQTAKNGNSSFHRANSEVKGAENPVERHIEGNYKCQCSICKVENLPKKDVPIKKPSIPVLDFFHGFDFHASTSNIESEKDFVFVLRKLMAPKELPYPLRLSIPETVAFVDGDVKFIALTEKDRRLRFIRNRERLGLLEIKRFFRESQKRKENELEQHEVHKHDLHIQSNRKQSVLHNMSMTGDKKGDHSMNDSLSRSMILKKNMKQKEVLHVQSSGRSKNKEVCLVKFKDDTTTVLTEVELDNILLKRKEDPTWHKIQYMQLYVATRRGMSTMQRVYFVYERDKISPLYERSLREIQYLNGELPKASQNYIPLHEEERFEEELSRTDPQSFYLYLLMKIHHFLEVVWNIRITKMGGDFIKDINGVTWIMNISRVHHEKLKLDTKANLLDSDRDDVQVNFDNNGNKISPHDPAHQQLIRMHPKGIGKHDALKVMRRVLRQRPRQNGDLNSQDSSATKDFITDENSPRLKQSKSPIMLMKKRNQRLSLETPSMSIASSPKRSRNPSRSLISATNGRSMAVRVSHIDYMEIRNDESEIRRRPKLLYLKNGYSLMNEGSMLAAMAKSTEIDVSSSCKSGARGTPVHWNEQGSVLSSVKNVQQGNISIKAALQHLRHNSGGLLQGTPNYHRGSFKEDTKGTIDTTPSLGGNFRERIGEMRIETNQKFETVDLNQIVMRSTHSQWVQNLNSKIKEKIKMQLRNRRFGKEPKEPVTTTTGLQTAEDI